MSADKADDTELRDLLLEKVPVEVADKILVSFGLTVVLTGSYLCFER